MTTCDLPINLYQKSTMKLSYQNLIVFFLFTRATAFLSPPVPAGMTTKTTLQMVNKNEDSFANSFRAFGIAAAIFTAVGSPTHVMAQIPLSQSQDMIYSSSIQVAETIKTMDMSLPSSYDAISDVKKSSVEELTQEENLLTGTVVKKVPKAATERIGVGEKMTSEQKAALKAEEAARKKAEKEAAAAEKVALAKVKAAEKAAQKEAKAKADAKKEEKSMEKQYESYKFVDAGLPSYGDSTTTKERSAFSL